MYLSSHSLFLRAAFGWLLILLAASGPLNIYAADGTGQNIVENGGFTEQSGNFFTGWALGGFVGGKPDTTEMWKNSAEMSGDEDGTSFLRVNCLDPDGADFAVSTKEKISLNPAWVSLDVSTETRVKDIVKLATWGGRIMISLTFYDGNDATISGEFFMPIPPETTSWETLQKSIAIPPGASTFTVAAHIIGANAVADFKKIEVVPN